MPCKWKSNAFYFDIGGKGSKNKRHVEYRFITCRGMLLVCLYNDSIVWGYLSRTSNTLFILKFQALQRASQIISEIREAPMW